MKRMGWAAIAMACATMSAAAQTSSTAQKTSDPQVTVTGCVQEGARTGADPNSVGYDLTNATIGTAPSSSATTGTTGTVGAAGSSSMDHQASYALDGHSSELKNHVGHRVEVTGMLANSSAGGATSSTPGAATTMNSMSPKLQVASIRMISTDCTK